MDFRRIHSSSLGKIFLGNFTIQLTSILQVIILARALGPEGKGIFTEVTLWPTIIAGFSILGLYTGIVKCVSKERVFERYNFAKTTLRLTSLLGILGSIVAVVFSFYHYRNANSTLLFLAISYSPFVLVNNIARGFVAIDHGRKDFKSYSITRAILNPLFFIIILFLWIFKSLSIRSTVFALLFANASVALIRVVLGLKKEDQSKQEFSSSWLLKYSIRFAPSDFSEPVYAYYDKAIVALVLSSYDLGIYTVAYSAAALISILPNVYSTKIFSDVAGGDSIQKALSSVRQNSILMLVAGLGLAFLMPYLVPIFVGPAFNEAIIPAIVLLIVCCLKGQSLILERTILAKGFPFVGISAKAITMIVFALLAFVLKALHFESLLSLVIISIITQVVYLVYLVLRMHSLFHIKIDLIPKGEDFTLVLKNIKSILK